MYKKNIKQLKCFQIRSLNSVVGIKWQDKVTKLDVLDRAQLMNIDAMRLIAKLRWKGHVNRMDNSRMTPQLLYRVLLDDHRNLRRPKDGIKDSLKYSDLLVKELGEGAQDRVRWQAFECSRRNKIACAR